MGRSPSRDVTDFLKHEIYSKGFPLLNPFPKGLFMKNLYVLTVLVLSNVCHAQTVANLQLHFPPMPVNRVGPGLMQAEREPFEGTLRFDNEMVLHVRGAIPLTFVRGFLAYYEVDACIGAGEVEGGQIVINLPPEPVRLRNGVMTALGIDASVTLTLEDGQVGTGILHFPDCPTELLSPGHRLAEAVDAHGTVTFP